MANATTKRVLEEGPKNAMVELTGVLDTSNATLAPAIQLSDFSNSEPNGTLLGFALDRVDYSITDQLSIQLLWKANTPRLICVLQGRGAFPAAHKYSPIQPVVADAGFDGGINLTTTGWASGTQSYTLLLQLRKIYKGGVI